MRSIPLLPGLATGLIPLMAALAVGCTSPVDHDPAQLAAGRSSPQTPDPSEAFEVTTRTSYLPGVAFVVQVDVFDARGQINKRLWETQATLEVVEGDVDIDTTTVRILHGRGSALVTPTGTGDFTLAVDVGDGRQLHSFTTLENAGQLGLSGPLEGESSTWNGIVRVTGDLLVPKVHTLTVEPGTIILVDPPVGEDLGTDIEIRGRLHIEGTAEDRITITATDPDVGWGQLLYSESPASTINHAEITRGGLAITVGHARTGPAIRMISSTLTIDNSAITDQVGKTLHADLSDLTIHNTHMGRAAMGPEVKASEFTIEDSWLTEMYGPDDNDGLYVRDQVDENQINYVRRVTIVDGNDDGMDVHFTSVEIEDCIMRGWDDKGLTIDAGEMWVHHVLLAENLRGLHCKNPSETYLSSSTVVGNSEKGLWAQFTEGRKPIMLIDVVDSIVWDNVDDLVANRSEDDIPVRYSTVGTTWSAAGEGVLTSDPQFVDAASSDYRLKPGSPSLDAGDPSSPQDIDGTRADQGFYPTDDADGDGFTEADGDCDDTAASRFPGAEEALNGEDDDCDTVVDEDLPTPTATPTPAVTATPGDGPTATLPPTAPEPTPTAPIPTYGPTDAPTPQPVTETPNHTPTEPQATDVPSTATPGDTEPSGCFGNKNEGSAGASVWMLLMAAGLLRRRRGGG